MTHTHTLAVPPSTTTLPLSQAQLGLWYDQQAHSETTVSHVAECIHLDGTLDIPRFQTALTRALQDTEILHVRFQDTQDGPQQHLKAYTPQPLVILDYRDALCPEQQAQQDMWKRLEQPFDLTTGPLYHNTLYLLADNKQQWLFLTHHILLDGYGFNLFLQRVAEYYQAKDHSTLPPFGSLTAVIAEDQQYQQSFQREQDRLALIQLYQEIPHTPALLLENGLLRGHRVSSTLSAELTAQLKHIGQRSKAGWSAVLFAMVARFWADLSTETEVFLGIPVMQRLGSPSAKVPCMHMNMVPLKFNLNHNPCLPELTQQAQQQLKYVRPHQRYRYEHLWQDLNWHRLFGPEVNVIPFGTEANFGPQLQVSVHNLVSGPVESLAFGFTAQGEQIIFTLDGHPEMFSKTELIEQQACFIHALQQQLLHFTPANHD